MPYSDCENEDRHRLRSENQMSAADVLQEYEMQQPVIAYIITEGPFQTCGSIIKSTSREAQHGNLLLCAETWGTY
ncbi:hypothetical protein LSAT2_017918 [Lamellibrachia satsuma]|nr:hypothetical protein LSAT2_017918 [Lamellibrachia satsuma]